MKSQSRYKAGSPLRESFPTEVLREADKFGSHIKQQDTAGRKDCRHDSVVSIDPSSALDLDDAFSLQRTRGKRWKLRVHVADVSHYVRPNSQLDREARLRGNSTYLVERVIPMLPSSLSNGLCSLHPDSDRLTKCVEFTLTDDGKVLETRFFSAFIRSKRRFTYHEAMDIIRGTQPGHLETMLRSSDRLAQKIRAQRIRSGSLEFQSREIRLLLNRRGRVKAIEPVIHDRAHQLIEEFMLLANEAVATHLSKLQRVTIHRSHDKPDLARLRKFRGSLRRHQIPCGKLKSHQEFQSLMTSLSRTPAGPALQIGLLRTLPRARYTTRSNGHFGLAKDHYVHFTSPIRRYADLLVHRTLFERKATNPHELYRIAEHLSTAEKNSSDAERVSKRSKLCDYLIHKLRCGDTTLHNAFVTQICTFGILIEVSELGVPGLIPRRLLKRNQYHLNLRQQQVKDRSSGRLITLGSSLRVTISDVDKEKQYIEFTPSSPSPKPRKKSKQRP